MNAGIEFLFFLLLFAGLALVCVAYWLRSVINHLLKKRAIEVIRESRYFQQGREIRSSHDCWEIEGRRVR